MDWVRAGEYMQPLVNSGDFKIWPASSGPRGGIGNEHFICGSSGTLQSSVTGFLCMDIMGCPISPSQVHTEWTQTEHHNPAPRNTIPSPFCSHTSSIPQQTCSFLCSAGVSILGKPWFLLLQGGVLIFPPLVRIFQSTSLQPRPTPVEMSCLPSITPTVCSRLST